LKEILSINYEEKKASLNFLCFLKKIKIIPGTNFCNMKKHDLKKYGPTKDQREREREVK